MNARKRVLVLVAILVLVAGGLAAVNYLTSRPPTGPPSDAGNSTGVFRFAASGDFGGPGDANMVAAAKRMAASNTTFLLALGDLGYTSDEPGWCSSIKGAFHHVEVIAGNHDTGESSGGQIDQYVTACPFTLDVPLVPGPGTPGYGYEYSFDYPDADPLVRFILITAGVRGSLGYDWSTTSAHYQWVVDSVNAARTAGIPWVVVGMHKQCVTVGAKTSCEMGQAIFDKLIELKVDLIVQGHDHVYERSKQLALSAACATVPSAGGFDGDCVVDDGIDATYTKDGGSVVVVQGVGGESLYDVRLDGSDAELAYFAQAMGGNANTQGKARGYGFVRYSVSSDRIVAQTDLCPLAGTGSDGHCPSAASGVFRDAFSIVRVIEPGYAGAVASPDPPSGRAARTNEAAPRLETASILAAKHASP